MHTEASLDLLRDTTTILGYELRRFAHVTCPAFVTRESQSEYDARKRAEQRRAKTSGGAASSSGDGRRPRAFNMKTIKLHFLGDYVACIQQNGTTDSYTTQIVGGALSKTCDSDAHYYVARASTSIAESRHGTNGQTTCSHMGSLSTWTFESPACD